MRSILRAAPVGIGLGHREQTAERSDDCSLVLLELRFLTTATAPQALKALCPTLDWLLAHRGRLTEWLPLLRSQDWFIDGDD